MHPLAFEEFARQHIEDLHREAAARRKVRSSRKRRSTRKPSATKRQRAPAA